MPFVAQYFPIQLNPFNGVREDELLRRVLEEILVMETVALKVRSFHLNWLDERSVVIL